MTENPQDQSGEGGQPPYSGQPTPPPPPPGPAPSYSQPAQGGAVSPSDARMWSMFAQLGGILFGFVPALVIYLVYRDRDPLIRRHSAQALNFQIILLIAYFISFVLTFLIIGFFTGFAVFICSIVFPIMAAIAANKGEDYTYPLVPQILT